MVFFKNFMLSPTVIGVGLQLDRNWTSLELHEVIHHRLQSSPSRPSWSPTRRSRVGLDWSCTRWTSVDSTQGHRVQVQRGKAELNFNLASMYLCSSECNFSAMLTSWEASTPRRSRGVLVLPTSQHCSWVNDGPPSATLVQCWRVGRQVHRGGAEVYLSSPRVNIAEESVEDHRVQLQCKFDEGRQVHRDEAEVYLPFLRVKFAPSRWSPTPITVGLNVSTLSAPPLQWVHWPVPLRSRVQWSLNRMEFWSKIEIANQRFLATRTFFQIWKSRLWTPLCKWSPMGIGLHF